LNLFSTQVNYSDLNSCKTGGICKIKDMQRFD